MFKIGDRIVITRDVLLVNGPGSVTTGMTGVIHNAVHSHIGRWSVKFDNDCYTILIDGLSMRLNGERNDSNQV